MALRQFLLARKLGGMMLPLSLSESETRSAGCGGPSGIHFLPGLARVPPGQTNRNSNRMFGMRIARIGTWMKALLVVSALGLFAPGALAAEPNCRTIESAGARLSCYDAAFPPKAKKPEADIDAPPSAYKDPFVAEEARTAAKLKNICRGC